MLPYVGRIKQLLGLSTCMHAVMGNSWGVWEHSRRAGGVCLWKELGKVFSGSFSVSFFSRCWEGSLLP